MQRTSQCNSQRTAHCKFRRWRSPDLQQWCEEDFYFYFKVISGRFKSFQGSSCVFACAQKRNKETNRKKERALKPNLLQDTLKPHLVTFPSSSDPSFVGWHRCNTGSNMHRNNSGNNNDNNTQCSTTNNTTRSNMASNNTSSRNLKIQSQRNLLLLTLSNK
jgi:hypothetical protein